MIARFLTFKTRPTQYSFIGSYSSTSEFRLINEYVLKPLLKQDANVAGITILAKLSDLN